MRRMMAMIGVAAAAVLAASNAVAQTAAIYGSLGNFDVVNHIGREAHGFEIELEGVQVNDVVYSFSVQRYGAAEVTSTPTGVRVRWASPYDAAAGQFSVRTIAHAPNTPFAGSCYQWGSNYDAAGCEHFGVSLAANPARTIYRWLAVDAANPSALAPVDPPEPIAGPVYTIVPPPAAGDPPALAVEVQAPQPPELPAQYGDAQWVKVFKTQVNREVGLDELVSDNPLVPQDAAHLETAWDIIQADPVGTAEGKQKRSRKRNQGSLDATTRAVVRRYEFYTYTGAYDPITHELLCADLTCSAPQDGELGDFVSAQMTAANVQVPSVSVAKIGNGSVSSVDRVISCGNKCTAYYTAGATTTLTAAPSSGTVFTGWSGACTGSAASCTLAVNDALAVGATFAPTFTLSVSRSNKGGITSSDGAIACGSGGGGCSAKYAQAALVTLTAVPPAGTQFLGWSGGCTGTDPTCRVIIAGNTQVQALFSK